MRVGRIIGQRNHIGIRNYIILFFISWALTISAAGTLADALDAPLPIEQVAGAVVEPPVGPIADTPRITSRQTAAPGTSSDMLQYSNRPDNARLHKVEHSIVGNQNNGILTPELELIV